MNNFPTGDVVTNNKLFTLNFFCTELQAGFFKKFFESVFPNNEMNLWTTSGIQVLPTRADLLI